MKWNLQTFADHVSLSLIRPDGSIVFSYVLRDKEEADTFQRGFFESAKLASYMAQDLMQIK